MIKKIIGASAILLMSSAASAGLINFDFTGGPTTLGDPLLFSQGGLGLTVTGEPGVSIDTHWGLGVKSARYDSSQVDGYGPNETLSFLFDQNVDLVSVMFGAVGSNDDFTLSVNGSLVTTADIPGGNFWDTNSSSFDFSSSSFNGNTFDFGVAGNYDDYYISGITVNTADVAAVSEPATLALLGLGLLGLGFSRRKLSA